MTPKPTPSPADAMRAELNRRSECRRVGFDDEALGIDMNLHSYAEALLSDHARLVEEIGRLREALTPSRETNAAYIGEFSHRVMSISDDGEEQYFDAMVPWTTIKEIMVAIRARATLSPSQKEGGGK